MRKYTLAILSFVLFAYGTADAQIQTNDQQKCINAMNKNGSKLNDTQCLENRACIKDYGQGRLTTGTFPAEECLTADRKGKILKREGKTVAHEIAFCTGVAPNFAKTPSATVNAAAVQAGIDLVHDIFGNPIDSGLALCETQPDECYCQRFMSKWLHKQFSVMPRIFRKCKKAALKVGKEPFFDGADSGDDIETCWDNSGVDPNLLSVVANPNNQVGKITDNLAAEYQTLCVDKNVDGTTFPGCPGGGDLTRDCIIERVNCRTCLMANAMDNLTIDCDAVDNGAVDASCP